jgi:hypothetical protein
MPFGWFFIVAVLAIVTATGARILPAPIQSAGSTALQKPSDGDAALNTFRAAVDSYLGVRKKISREIPPLTVTPRAAEITAASDALARAVQRARPGARQGAFFTPEVAAVFQRQLEQALRGSDREAILALITEEPVAAKRPSIHMRYPQGDVLATTPAVVLAALPPLPRELEYRFIGTALVLRDIEAALVLDYLPNAIRLR